MESEMADRNKTQFILRKKDLSLKELSAQSGLSEEEIRSILEKEGQGPSGPSAGWFLPPGLALLALFTVVVLAYLPVLQNDFVNWDDKDAILDNPFIRHWDGAFLKWSFTTYATGNWMPLTWLSFALNFQMAGLDPRVFHLTNVLLHALNSLLVLGVSWRLLRAIPAGPMGWAKAFAFPIAFLTALLFGLHPIHVESVAWATERKDVLYAAFYLGSLWVYLGRGTPPEKRELWSCLALYLLSLMSKPMAVTLPLVLLILDIWPLGRLREGLGVLLREKIPFFVLASLSVLVTMASHAKTLSYAQSGVEVYWILNSFRSLVFYLVKMAVPWNLSPYYPFPPEMTAGYILEDLGAAALVVFGSIFFYRRRDKFPDGMAAWAYYLVTLAPVLGVVQTGAQAAADRYTYLPSLGFFLFLSAAVARWVALDRKVFAVVCLVVGAGLGYLTVFQIGVWRNTSVLWERVTQIYPDENADAYSRLGVAYLKARRFDDALAAFSRASAIPPPLARTFHGLGTALTYKDRLPEAIQAFNYALTLDPSLTAPRQNLWNIYEREGNHAEAIHQMEEALKVEPSTAAFYNNLGVSYGFLKKNREAQAAFEKAHRLDGENPEYLVNLATVLDWEGKKEKALALYREGARQRPREALYHLKMADLYLSQNLRAKALDQLKTAWALGPQEVKIIHQIGEDFQKLGRTELAQGCFEQEKKTSGMRELVR